MKILLRIWYDISRLPTNPDRQQRNEDIGMTLFETEFHHTLPGMDSIHIDWYHRIAPAGAVYEKQHCHDYFELYMLLEGDVTFVVNETIFSLQAGDILITRPYQYHHAVCNTKHDHICVNIFTVDTTLCGTLEEMSRIALLHLSPTVRQQIKDLCIGQTEQTPSSSCFEHYQRLYGLLALLESENQSPTLLPSSFCPPLLTQILHYINENYRNIRQIRQIYEEFFISRTTLNRLFATHMGVTPLSYVEFLRLSSAARSLMHGKSVQVVSDENGFSDCSHFIAKFKKHFGVTPAKYRRGDRLNQ